MNIKILLSKLLFHAKNDRIFFSFKISYNNGYNLVKSVEQMSNQNKQTSIFMWKFSPWFVFLLEGISWRILQAWNFNDLLEFSYFQTSMYVHQVLKRVKTSLKGQCKLRVYIIRKCIYVPFAIFYLFFFCISSTQFDQTFHAKDNKQQ